MRLSTSLILSTSLVCLLAVGDSFSRGFGSRGGMSGGGSSYRSSGSAHRSPSMGYSSTSHRSYSGSTARAREAQPARRPASTTTKPSYKPTARPATPSPKHAATRPTQAQVKNFLDSPGKGGVSMSSTNLVKVGAGAAGAALGVEAARQLLAQHPAPPPTRPGGPAKPQPPGTRPPHKPGQPIGPRPEHPIARPPHHPHHPPGPPPHPVHPIARPPYNHIPPHWWRWAAWGAAAGWVAGGVAGGAYSEPYYYSYGDNVSVDGDYVYFDGQPTATVTEYYEQAKQIASSAPPETKVNEKDWLPLGVYGLYQGDAKDSNMLLQLAVNKSGVISGTYYNMATNLERPISGMVDKKTQRAAWTFADGKNTEVVMEAGLANLTEDRSTALVHFGKDKTEQWLMVRQPEPKQGSGK